MNKIIFTFIIFVFSTSIGYCQGIEWIREYTDGNNGYVEILSDQLIEYEEKATNSPPQLTILFPTSMIQDKNISMHINVLDLIDVQPSQFKLNQNFPNPFNPSTSISVEIERDSFGSLIIYNINGQIVNILNVGYFKAGVTQFKWNGLDISGNAVSGGTYIYRLEIDGLSQSHKMVLLK